MDIGANEASETNRQRRKRRLRLFAGLFVGVLAALTLLGNTLLAFTLPKVSALPARSGSLQASYDATAILQPIEELSLTNPAGWKVKQVLAKEGESVRKGQVLVTYDDGAARGQLEDEQASLQKQELQVELLQQQYIQAVQSGDEAARIAAKAALESASIDIAGQQKHIAAMQEELTENGRLVAPVDGIVKEVHALEGTSGASAGPDVLLVSSGGGYRFELRPPAALAASLRVGDKLEAQVQAQVQGQGGDADGERTVEAVVTAIEQEFAASSTDGGRFGTYGGGDAIGAADGATGIATGGAAVPGYRVVARVSGDTIRGGEAVQVHLEQDASEEEADTVLVPSAAIHVDGSGSYVLVVEERQGALGNAYYASRRSIVVQGSSGGMSAVAGNLFDGQPVIAESEEPLSDGERVRL